MFNTESVNPQVDIAKPMPLNLMYIFQRVTDILKEFTDAISKVETHLR